MEKIRFPKDFIFGTATSAAQLEGAAGEDGRGLSIWDAFSRIPGSIADGSTPENACDMYHRYEEDLDLAKRMNLDSFRFSFSWSRILPEGKGKVSQKGIDFYKRLIDGMRKRDLIPNATIYHWDLPYELERLGGWLTGMWWTGMGNMHRYCTGNSGIRFRSGQPSMNRLQPMWDMHWAVLRRALSWKNTEGRQTTIFFLPMGRGSDVSGRKI